MYKYRSRIGPSSPARPAPTARKTSLGYVKLGIPSKYNVLANDDMNWNDNSVETPSVDKEYKAYVNGTRARIDVDLVKYWDVSDLYLLDLQLLSYKRHFQKHGDEYPIVFLMAMDFLPIQASSVPCERVFSSSAETDTSRRNRLSPVLMEALQMLKFALKDNPLNFTNDILTSEEDLLPRKVRPRNDLLGELASSRRGEDREDVMDNIVVAIE